MRICSGHDPQLIGKIKRKKRTNRHNRQTKPSDKIRAVPERNTKQVPPRLDNPSARLLFFGLSGFRGDARGFKSSLLNFVSFCRSLELPFDNSEVFVLHFNFIVFGETKRRFH